MAWTTALVMSGESDHVPDMNRGHGISEYATLDLAARSQFVSKFQVMVAINQSQLEAFSN